MIDRIKRTVLGLLFASLAVSALAEDHPMAARMKEISDRYNECVYSSAISQMRPGATDINLAAERAFGSCTTETAQMLKIMQQNGLTADQIDTVFLDKKTGIKREMRKILEEVETGKK